MAVSSAARKVCSKAREGVMGAKIILPPPPRAWSHPRDSGPFRTTPKSEGERDGERKKGEKRVKERLAPRSR